MIHISLVRRCVNANACNRRDNTDFVEIIARALNCFANPLAICQKKEYMPFHFGIIRKSGNKTLVFHYWMNSEKDRNKGYADSVHEAHIVISHDDGYTWDEDYIIAVGRMDKKLFLQEKR